MDHADALDDEMRRPGNPVAPLDPTMAERILDGAVPEEDVPPDYRDVVRVLAAAAAPALPLPSAEAAALAAFRSTHRPVDPARRTSVLSKLLSAKAVAAVVLGTASLGTAAAAATGSLPDAAQAKAHSIISAVPASDRAEAGAGAESGGGARSAAHEPTALPGAAGLCQAYGSGQGGENGGRLDSAGFQRLADAAAGADGIAAYCAKVMAASRAGGSASAGSQAGTHPDALTGACRSWLAAEKAGRTATLGKAVLDRLVAAAGGPDAIADYCTQLVGSAPGGSKPSDAPAQPTHSPGGDSGGNGDARPTPSHPVPPPTAVPTPVPAPGG